VKLINTDGIAFIGPGSVWFRTMLQFTALAITFYAIYRQLRAGQRTPSARIASRRPTDGRSGAVGHDSDPYP
jgi:hypothetical protein